MGRAYWLPAVAPAFIAIIFRPLFAAPSFPATKAFAFVLASMKDFVASIFAPVTARCRGGRVEHSKRTQTKQDRQRKSQTKIRTFHEHLLNRYAADATCGVVNGRLRRARHGFSKGFVNRVYLLAWPLQTIELLSRDLMRRELSRAMISPRGHAEF